MRRAVESRESRVERARRASFYFLFSIFVFAVGARGQDIFSAIQFNGVPTGSCSVNQTAFDYNNGDFYTCKASAWSKVGGAAGAVSSVFGRTGPVAASASDYSWDQIASKPSTFPPATHTHAESDVTGLVTDLGNKEATAKKNAASGYAGLSAGSKLAASQMSGVLASSDLTNDSALEKTANKNAASGYAGLDASSKLTGSQQVYGAAANTAAQGNDSRITGAEQTANKNAASGYPGLNASSQIAAAQVPFAAPGSIGNTTPGSGAFTTLSASSTVSGTGFSTYLASPPAIGGTAAAAGSFTTLAASSTVSGTGFTNRFAAPGPIGSTTASTGKFTTLTETNLLISNTAPTISSGFGTSPTIPANNGTAAFTVNVGTGGTATAGVIGMPTAAAGWICSVNNLTAAAGHVAYNTRQTASTTTTVTVENQTTSTGAAVAWAASNILTLSCHGY